MNESPILSGLNAPQREAVECISGPLLILAGAGSGKTKSLTHRIVHMIANGISGDSILAVTFTNKAANEMKGRIEKLLHTMGQMNVYNMPSMGTFHAICVRILRRDIEALECGLTSNFVIFDTADQRSLMKTVMKEKGYDDKEIKHRPVLSHISSAKNTLIPPHEYAQSTEMNRFTKAVNDLYGVYQKRLTDHNALDFDDLIMLVVKLFEQRPEILERYRSRWNHVMVDEYQDTNFAQYRLVRLLADEHQNLCVIGDDHQSIYAFRGADYTNILNFEKDFPQAKIVKLEQNYRSTGNILVNANKVIGHNRTGRDKKLWTQNEPGETVKVIQVANEKEEANIIAKNILEMYRAEDAKLSDCVVLYRMNAQSRVIEEAFMRNQIPYTIVGGTRFFDRKEIKDIVAYLRLIFNPRDDVAFLRIINAPKRSIGPSTMKIVQQYSQHYTMSMLEVLKNSHDIEELSASKRAKLQEFYDMIAKLRAEYLDKPISILLDRVVEATGFMAYLDDGTGEGEARQQNVKELFSVAMKYDSADDPLGAFLEGVALISDLDKYDQDADSVTLMTMHSAKGLEFPVVFLPGWEEGVFPGAKSMQDPTQLEEERRLAYVAITRAEKKCCILSAKQRTIFGRTEYSRPSLFLAELDDEATEWTDLSTDGYSGSRRYASRTSGNSYGGSSSSNGMVRSQTTNFGKTYVPAASNREKALWGKSGALNDTGYGISDKVQHAEYGEGTVIQISGDVLTIAFSGLGVKKIVASVAPLEKMQ